MGKLLTVRIPFLFWLLLSISLIPFPGFAQSNVKTDSALQKTANPTKPVILNPLPSQPKGSGSMDPKAQCEGKMASITFTALKTANPTKPRPVNTSSFTLIQVSILQKNAALIKGTPDCQIRVSGHGASTKQDQQTSWNRVNAVIRYLIEKAGISETRFIFVYGIAGDINTVDLSFTSEDGPQTLPAPHPNLRGLQ